MIIVLFGVSGSGKTAIGGQLAKELNWKFNDADDFHPKSNLEKMQRGIALTDLDRQPWLERLRELIEQSIAVGQNMVLACSALKEQYRERLHVSDEVKWVYLRGEYDLIANRLARRRNHFMRGHLLQSQFNILEEPADPDVTVNIGLSPEAIIQIIRKKLRT